MRVEAHKVRYPWRTVLKQKTMSDPSKKKKKNIIDKNREQKR